jgi:hypothetical protein
MRKRRTMKRRIIQTLSIGLFTASWGAGIAAIVGWSSPMWLPPNLETHARFESAYWKYTAPLLPIICFVAGSGGYATYILLKWALQDSQDERIEFTPPELTDEPDTDEPAPMLLDPTDLLFADRVTQLEAQYNQTPPPRTNHVPDPLESL